MTSPDSPSRSCKWIGYPRPAVTNINHQLEMEKKMKLPLNRLFYGALTLLGLLSGVPSMRAEKVESAATVPVRMTVTANVSDNKRMPAINQDDVLVKRGNDRLAVTEWTPAQGDRAGLELFILIDDVSDGSLGLQLDSLRGFIKDQPSSTLIGVGYMRNATVQIVQDLTTNHVQAANALRLPMGTGGAFANPYLSVTDLMKRWPASENRHEVLMITDGADRGRHHGWRVGYQLSPDADTAIAKAQKTGTNIHTIYAPANNHMYRGYWQALNGQANMARLSESTGGMSFYLGLHSAVSFDPYLRDLQKALNNQYLLSFDAKPAKKAGLQQIALSTEVAGVDIASHNAVWVPAAKP